MSSLPTAVPPGVVLLIVAVGVALLPRRVGHALGVLATGAVVPWALTVPAGAHYDAYFLGFRTVFLNVDEFSRLMGVIFGLIGAAAVLYSASTGADRVQTGFALSYVATSIGAVFAGDWLTLVFFWELMAVTSTLLVWHYGGPAVRAGFRYGLFHAVGGSLLMGAVLWHYTRAGTFLFADVAAAVADPGVAAASLDPGISAGVPAALAALGIGVNVGFVGLHVWLPDTYPRPHVAASVFLSVYTTKTGVYVMFRAFPEGHLWIAYMGGAMAVVGAAYALLQNDMRRLLSYHIVSQVGYMIAGVGLGTALATAGAFAHVFNHILYKSLLFMTAGVVVYRTGEEDLKRLGGLAREMPVTAVAFTVAALSIGGFPWFNGFVSKGMVTAAAHDEQRQVLYYLLLAGGVGTFLSFVKFGYYAFFHGSHDGSVADANLGQSVPMLAVAGLCVVFGLYPDALYPLLPEMGAADPHPYTVGHVLQGLGLAAAGLVGFLLLKRPLARLGRVPDVDSLYAPATLYGTRAVVVGLTETYARVDRAAVAGVRAATAVVADPAATLRRVPGVSLAGSETSEDDPPNYPLRATIGVTVLVLAFVVTATLVVFSV